MHLCLCHRKYRSWSVRRETNKGWEWTDAAIRIRRSERVNRSVGTWGDGIRSNVRRQAYTREREREREREGGGENAQFTCTGWSALRCCRSFTSDFRPPYKAMVLLVYFSCTSCLFVDASQSRISGRKREMQMEQWPCDARVTLELIIRTINLPLSNFWSQCCGQTNPRRAVRKRIILVLRRLRDVNSSETWYGIMITIFLSGEVRRLAILHWKILNRARD